MRAAGFTHAAISERTGISISSLKRLFKTYSIEKGKLKQSVIDKATDELLNDATAVEAIKREVSSLILDDLAMVKRLRVAMAEATEVLEATNTAEALQVMRAVSAGAVALKSTSETLRKSLGIDSIDEIDDELPELTITVLTNEEIGEIKAAASARSAGLDGGLDSISDNDVVIEGEGNDLLVVAR